MARPRTRLIWLIATLPAVMFISAVIYMFGMAHLEGDPRSFLDSLAWAAETLSTTGYGVDGRWQHPAMVPWCSTRILPGLCLDYYSFQPTTPHYSTDSA